MKPKLLSLDVYNTLLFPTGSLGGMACAVAKQMEISDLAPNAAQLYQEIVYELTRNAAGKSGPSGQDALWQQACSQWLERSGSGARVDAAEFAAAMQKKVRVEPHRLFRSFPDVEPAFEALASKEVRVCALSNWDFTLDAVLSAYQWRGRFEFVVPCLIFGLNKPNPQSYHLLCELSGLEPQEILHVGDSLVDDYIAPKSLGFQARHIERGSLSTSHSARSLLEIVEAL